MGRYHWLALLALLTTLIIWCVPALVPATAFDFAVRLALHPICHQNPARTLVLAGDPMPVCARCASIYTGIAAGILFAGTFATRRHPAATRWRLCLAVIAVGAITTTVELSAELTHSSAGNLSRFAASLPLGFGAGLSAGCALLARGADDFLQPGHNFWAHLRP